VRLFEELGRLHAGLRAVWEPGPPEPLDDHRTVRQLRYWLGFTRRRLGTAADAVVARAGHLLDQLAAARKGVELPRAPIHGDYKLGNAVALENGSWANLDLDFVRVRERIYDVAGSLYWAVESGAELDRRLLLEAYDRTAPEPLTADETRLLPTALTWIPLHWVATAGFIGGVPEAERALAAAEAWWSGREDRSWYPERPSQVAGWGLSRCFEAWGKCRRGVEASAVSANELEPVERAARARRTLAMLSSAFAVQTNGLGSSFQAARNASMAAINWGTERNAPRRTALLVSSAKKRSTRLSQDDVGVKWR
jgi:hypothetical protein